MLNDFNSDAEVPHQLTVGIIGGGHLGKQLARLIVESSGIKPPNIKVSSRRPGTLGKIWIIAVTYRALEQVNELVIFVF